MGCIRAAASVVIVGDIAPHVVDGALQCVPADVLPRADDTREILAARLGESEFLDDAHVLNGGNGRRGKHGPTKCNLSWCEVRVMNEDVRTFAGRSNLTMDGADARAATVKGVSIV